MPDDFETPPAMPRKGFTPRMLDWWEDVRDWLVAHRPVGGIGGPLPDAPGGGKLINLLPRGRGGTAAEDTGAWLPVVVADPDGGLLFGIVPGVIWTGASSRATDALSVEGEGGTGGGLVATANPDPSDSGLRSLPTPGDCGYIEIPIVNGSGVPQPGGTATVKFGAHWTNYPDDTEVDLTTPLFPVHTFERILIGYCSVAPADHATVTWDAGEGESHCWVRTVDSNISLVKRNAAGRVILVVPAVNPQLFVTG